MAGFFLDKSIWFHHMCARICGIINPNFPFMAWRCHINKGTMGTRSRRVHVSDTRALFAGLDKTPCSCQSKKKWLLKNVYKTLGVNGALAIFLLPTCPVDWALSTFLGLSQLPVPKMFELYQWFGALRRWKWVENPPFLKCIWQEELHRTWGILSHRGPQLMGLEKLQHLRSLFFSSSCSFNI